MDVAHSGSNTISDVPSSSFTNHPYIDHVPPHHGSFPPVESFVPSSLAIPQPVHPINFLPPYYSSPQAVLPPPLIFPSYPVPAPLPQRPLPPEDPELYPKIVNQIEYYFSKENLVKDVYLRRKMDRYGWVDVSVIANFNKIKALTSNIYHVLEALAPSSTVQVRGHKMRRRYNWKEWIFAQDYQIPVNNDVTNLTEENTGNDVTELTEQVRSISLKNTD